MADKWLMYEPSIRVPLIVFDPRLPDSARGKSAELMTLNIDLAPTLLDYAGVPIPGAVQGKSLRPLVRGERPADWRKDWFYEHHTQPKILPPSEGVRTEQWKYVRWMAAEPNVEELYDLRADPQEEHDLAADPAHHDTLERLRRRWAEFRDQLQ